jgi:hypothetical protein
MAVLHMLISRKGGHAGGCLPLLSSRTSSATPLCSQEAVLHRCAFAKTLHNTKACCYFSLYRPLQVSCRGPDHATAKARSAWGAVSTHDRNKQCYTAVLATSSATPLCFCQAVLHRCTRNKQCYTAVLLPKTLHNTKLHAE